MDVRSIYLKSFENQNITKWLIIAIFVNLAFFSTGYFSYDEQMQILEFMNYKIQGDSSYVLSWEFNARIRSWLLPAIFYVIKKIINIDNQFVVATVFRVFSSSLFLVSFFYFFNSLKKLLSKEKHFFIFVFSAIFWPIVYFSARTSSENYSQIFLLFSLAFLLKSFEKSEKKLDLNVLFQKMDFHKIPIVYAGVFLGLAFEARFQVAFIVVFISLWFLFNTKNIVTFFTLLSSGFLFVLLVSLFIDWWGYGELVFPPYGYFYQNIVQNVASRFGVSPFYGYFTDSLTSFFLPIYIVYFLSFFYCFYKRKIPLFIFSTIPFYLIHFMIPHKEGRFLIPVLLFTLIPVLSILFDFLFEKNLSSYNKISFILRVFAYSYLFLNILFLIYYSFSGKALVSYYDFVWKNKIENQNIYDVTGGVPIIYTAKFYDRSNRYIDFSEKSIIQSISDAMGAEKRIFYVLYNSRKHPQFLEDDAKIKEHCGLIYSSSFISDETYKKFPKLDVLFKNATRYRFYKCQKG